MAVLRVSVISPERVLYEGEARSVVAPAYDGEVGILPSHAPLMAVLGRGVLRVQTAGEALRALISGDPTPEVRQVAFIDAAGRVAVHTGSKAIQGAGHRTGRNYSVQANLMLTETVPEAMARAFERAKAT